MNNKGFTLIELLVVIAIIGILAGIVLAALGNTRSLGGDAGVEGNLRNLRTQSEIYYQATSGGVYSYSGFCASTNAQNALKATANAAGLNFTSAYNANGTGAAGKITCNESPSAWAANAPLKSNTSYFWCVDSNGFTGTTSAAVLNYSTSDFSCN